MSSFGKQLSVVSVMTDLNVCVLPRTALTVIGVTSTWGYGNTSITIDWFMVWPRSLITHVNSPAHTHKMTKYPKGIKIGEILQNMAKFDNKTTFSFLKCFLCLCFRFFYCTIGSLHTKSVVGENTHIHANRSLGIFSPTIG